MVEITSKRDYKIDWIRAICSLTIIFAHVNAPSFLNNIRTFDVVALVFISGMSLGLSKEKKYRDYILGRVKKLLVPTYLIITLIFLLSYLGCSFLHIDPLYSLDQIVRSYFLLSDGSMGYVWIVRVYMMVALLMPLHRQLSDKLENNRLFFVAMLGFLIFGAGLYYLWTIIPDSLASTIYKDYLYCTFVYGCISFLGYWLTKHQNNLSFITLITALCFVICQAFELFIGNGFAPNSTKYPPQLYYCSYGLFVAIILYHVVPNRSNKIVGWLSSHSFSIYLWHIFMLRLYGVITKISIFKRFEKMWPIEFLIVAAGAILLTYIWQKMLQKTSRGKA